MDACGGVRDAGEVLEVRPVGFVLLAGVEARGHCGGGCGCGVHG